MQRLSPQFYRDGLLQHTRAVSHTGEPLQQGAGAFARCSSTRFSLRQTAAAPRCSAALRCIIYSYRSRLLQHWEFSPWHTAAANRCSISVRYIIFLTPAYRCGRLLQRTRAGAAVDGCSILSSGHRCSKLLQHAWLVLQYSHMLRSSAAALEKTPGWPLGRVSSQAVEQFLDLLRSLLLH